MNIIRKAMVAGAAFGSLAAGGAQAAVLDIDAGWKKINVGLLGGSLADALSGDKTYDFTLTQAAQLNVVDTLGIGDVFALYNKGSLIGTTGAFNIIGALTTDPDTAFNGNTYSKLSVTLAPGDYSISGKLAATSLLGGSAYIQLKSVGAAVPEPATWALMILGFGAVGYAMRRRERSARVQMI